MLFYWAESALSVFYLPFLFKNSRISTKIYEIKISKVQTHPYDWDKPALRTNLKSKVSTLFSCYANENPNSSIHILTSKLTSKFRDKLDNQRPPSHTNRKNIDNVSTFKLMSSTGNVNCQEMIILKYVKQILQLKQ